MDSYLQVDVVADDQTFYREGRLDVAGFSFVTQRIDLLTVLVELG